MWRYLQISNTAIHVDRNISEVFFQVTDRAGEYSNVCIMQRSILVSHHFLWHMMGIFSVGVMTLKAIFGMTRIAMCMKSTIKRHRMIRWKTLIPGSYLYLAGNLARISYRGKGITMCGVKEADPRLASQKLTGETMNQSKNLYPPAVAGAIRRWKNNDNFVFDEMVEAFMEIERRGYCMFENERKYVNIKCVIVGDMSFLHKYL